MRQYEETHSWLKFQLDLRKVSYKLWMALGEAQSKCEHITGVPLQPSTSQELHQVYLVKGVLATTAIEGNTLTEEEVRQLVEKKLKVPPSKDYLARAVENIIIACNQIADRLLKGESADLTVSDIKNFNRLVLEGLPLEEGTEPGKIRRRSAVVGNYRGAPAEDCEYLLERLCEWLNSRDFRTTENLTIAFSLLKAIIAHLYLAGIHPFGDGNGRTARLMELQVLVAAGVPKPAAHLLSNHYNQTRQEYYRQLDQASKSSGDVVPFIEYAVLGFVDGLKAQLETIRKQQWDVAWENYVHDLFRDKISKADIRRRHLVLDLSNLDKPVPFPKLSEISPRMARYYATKTQKTISRDVNELVEIGLVEKTPEGVRPMRETILAFLPSRRIIKAGQSS